MEDTETYGLTLEQMEALGEKIKENVGKPKVLTKADYSSGKNYVEIWKLPYGLYTPDNRGKHTTDNDWVNWKAYSDDNSSQLNCNMFLVTERPQGNDNPDYPRIIYLFYGGGADLYGWWKLDVLYVGGFGSLEYRYRLLSTAEVVDNLTSTSSIYPLSAKQGKALKDLVDSIAIRGTGAPTTSTVGQVGTLYEDTTNGDLYICTDATNPYVWEEVGAGGAEEINSTDWSALWQ